MKIFLSHNSNDKPTVEAIASWLSKKGCTVWFDKWSLSAGDSLIEKISDGIESSDRLVVFLSPHSENSNWVKKELGTGLILELAEEKGLGEKFVIPAILKPCKVPILLRDKLYANFTNKSFESACEELLNGILNKPLGVQDKKLENKFIRYWNTKPLATGKFAAILEFGVQLSPSNGLSIGIDTKVNYFNNQEWFNSPNLPQVPSSINLAFTNTGKRIEPPIFARKCETPSLSSTKSYYVYIESNEEIKHEKLIVEFTDCYGNEP